jgi:hypothetical protein
MLKNILKVNGTKQLSKKNQTSIAGGHYCPGNPCDSYSGPTSYGYPGGPSCAQYHALPSEYQMCVRVFVGCFGI